MPIGFQFPKVWMQVRPGAHRTQDHAVRQPPPAREVTVVGGRQPLTVSAMNAVDDLNTWSQVVSRT
ncbi:hypothetical protein GS415_06935 [Rhodococcus hoagii]|nr:hypothetical protein [Prescottella equi]